MPNWRRCSDRRGRCRCSGTDRVGKLLRGLEALVGAFGERLAHDGVHRGRQLNVERGGRQRLFLEYLLHGRGRRSGKRPLAGQELVEDDPGREQVGASIHRQAHDLLGRHVARRAHDRAHLRQVRGFDVGNPEIGNLHRAVRQQEDVRRFDVAVDDALTMRIPERVEDLPHDPHDIGDLEALVRLEALLELATLHELHRDVPDAVVLAEVVDGDNVWVIEPARRLRFAAEAGDHGRGIFAGKLFGADGLERDDALDRRIVALVDDAHRPAPDLAPDLVFADAAQICHGSLRARKRRRRRAAGVARSHLCISSFVVSLSNHERTRASPFDRLRADGD